MQAIFNNCTFCGKVLPRDEEKCSREHVIPEFIGGSLVIRDVCAQCNSHLGEHVDHLILEDPRIINAVNSLDLHELRQKIAERGRTVGKDTVSGAKVEGIVVSGHPKLCTHKIEPDVIIAPEEEAKAILIKQVERDERLNWSSEKVKAHVENHVWSEYLKLSFGEERNFPEIGRTLRRGRVGNFVTNPKWSPNAAHRLVAKIIFEICHYTLDWPLLQAVIEDLNWYGAFAYGEKQEEEGRIYQRIQDEIPSTAYHHLIQILFYDRSIAVDVDFFQSVNFRGELHPKRKYTLTKYEGEEIEGIGIAMTFEPSKQHEKFIAFRQRNTGRWIESRASGI